MHLPTNQCPLGQHAIFQHMWIPTKVSSTRTQQRGKRTRRSLCNMKRMHVGQFDARARSLTNVAHKTPLTCSPLCLPQHHQLRERAPMAVNTTVREQETSNAKFAGRRHDPNERGSIAQAPLCPSGSQRARPMSIGMNPHVRPPSSQKACSIFICKAPRVRPSGLQKASSISLRKAPLRKPRVVHQARKETLQFPSARIPASVHRARSKASSISIRKAPRLRPSGLLNASSMPACKVQGRCPSARIPASVHQARKRASSISIRKAPRIRPSVLHKASSISLRKAPLRKPRVVHRACKMQAQCPIRKAPLRKPRGQSPQ